MKKIFTFCVPLLISIQHSIVLAQCALPPCKSIQASADKVICLADKVVLEATGAEGDYHWTSLDAGATISYPDSQTTQVNFTSTGKFRFVVSGTERVGNIATDGSFELFKDSDNYNPAQPNRAFETTYRTATGQNGKFITDGGEFRVDDTIVAYSSNTFLCNNSSYWYKTYPLTGKVASRGNILYADAMAQMSQKPYTAAFGNANPLWRLSNQPVVPNTAYTFSVDISNWNAGSPASEIMLLVNGVALNNMSITPAGGTIATGPDGSKYYQYPPNEYCAWRTVTGMWNSGSNTTATIAIAEVSNVLMGHEIALDDIAFSVGYGTNHDTVTVTVENCNITGLSTFEETLAPTIYPNPASGYVQLKGASSGTFSVHDMLGTKVIDVEIGEDNKVNVEALPKGIYLYQLSSEGHLYKGTLFLK